MNSTKPEKIFLVILSALLFIGATVLYIKETHIRPRIMIIEGGVKEERTLREVEEQLKEARRVNINTAKMNELQTIPGIGETFAARIIEYRNTRGSFETETDLLNIEGIGEKKLEKMREYIKF